MLFKNDEEWFMAVLKLVFYDGSEWSSVWMCNFNAVQERRWVEVNYRNKFLQLFSGCLMFPGWTVLRCSSYF